MQLVRLHLSAGRIDNARTLANHLLEEGPADALPAVAEALAQGGQRPFARELLAAAVRRTRDPQLRFQEQRVLTAQLAVTGEEPAAFSREMHRLEIFARADAGLRSAFVIARAEMARQRGANTWLEGELVREWDHCKGDIDAGEKLAGFYLETHREDDLREVIAAIDHHPDLPEQTLHALEAQLVQAGRGSLALPMLERLRRRFPQNEWYAEDQARAFWQAGKRDEACRELEALDATTVFREDLVGAVGTIYLELGDMARARRKFEAVARYDFPVVHYPLIALNLARLNLEDRQFAEAHRWLRRAYRNPTCVNPAPLVDYLASSGQLGADHADRMTPGGDFPLTFPRRAQLLAAIDERLAGSGQAADANRWVESHPELFAGAPGLVAEIRKRIAPADLPAFVALVESAASQTEPPVPQLGRELAALYVQWADRDSTNSNDLLDHLSRANDLDPDNFPIAKRLATACLARGQNDRASAALAGFLGPDALPSERASARQMLSTMPSKTDPMRKEG